MTNKQAVEELRRRGYEVSYETRKDGGIRITSIKDRSGEQVYSKETNKTGNQSEGNKVASKIVGRHLSRAQRAQRLKINKAKKLKAEVKAKKEKKAKAKKKAEYKKAAKLTKAEKKALRKAQKQAREAGKGGKIKKREFVRRKQREGSQRAKQAAKNTAQHLSGYAYATQVQAFIDYLSENGLMECYGMRDIARRLKPFALGHKNIMDSILQELYRLAYELVKGMNNNSATDTFQQSIYHQMKDAISNNIDSKF